MNFRIGLAEGWRRLHRKGTVIASLCFTTVVGTGPLIAQAWASMPPDLKAAIPQNVQQWIAYTLFGLVFLGLRYTTIERKPKEDQP